MHHYPSIFKNMDVVETRDLTTYDNEITKLSFYYISYFIYIHSYFIESPFSMLRSMQYSSGSTPRNKAVYLVEKASRTHNLNYEVAVKYVHAFCSI